MGAVAGVAITLVRPSLLAVAVASACMGLVLGTLVGLLRLGPQLREAFPARRKRLRAAGAVLMVAALASLAAAWVILLSGSGDDAGQSATAAVPAALERELPDPKDGTATWARQTRVGTAKYVAELRMDVDRRQWRVEEYFEVDSKALAMAAGVTVGSPAAARLSGRLVDEARKDGWVATSTERGLRLDRTRHQEVRIRQLPHLLTANEIALVTLRWSPRKGVTSTLCPKKGSSVTLRTPRGMVLNAHPPSEPYDVPGGNALTQLKLTDDANPYGETLAEMDLANRWGRTPFFAMVLSVGLWGGVSWLIGGVITAVIGALASALVPRALARRLRKLEEPASAAGRGPTPAAS
jgi:hypothetical protein